MKRKRMSGAERKDQIAQIAAKMFARNGFAGTAVKTIADRARVSEPMIFKLFGSKSGLVGHLPEMEHIVSLREKFLAQLRRLAAANDDEGVFGSIAETVLTHHLRDATFVRLALFLALERQQTAKTVFAERAHKFFTFLAGYIRRRTAAGIFVDVDPQIAARAFLGMLGYLIILRQVFGEQGSRRIGAKRGARVITEIFLNGLRKR